MKAHDAIIRLLHAEDVDTVFTLMSEDTMRLMSTVEEEWEDVRMVKTRHEQGAMAMADAYARAGNDLGVCLVGRGPAIAQTGNAMVTARKAGSNLLVIVPEPSLDDRYDIKAFDQEGYLQSTIGKVESIRSRETLIEEFRDALRRVRVGDGPLAVQIPWDVLDGEMDVPAGLGRESVTDAQPIRGVSPRVQPDPDLVSQAVDLYVDSDAFQPPVILAGRGAVAAAAGEAIEELAERTSALLSTSLQGRNYLGDHPFHLGVTGSWGSDLANRYVNEANLVIAVGASLNPYTIDKGHVFGDRTQVIHVDTDPVSIGRYADIELGIQGDARATVAAINDELERRGIHREGELWTDDLREEIASAETMNDREYPDVPDTVDPRELVSRLNELLPADRKVVVDGGHFARWVVDAIETPPADFTFTPTFASIGLGLPAGIGTAVGADDHACVTVCGDSGFMMSLQELETAVRDDVPMTIVVMNDSSLGTEYHSLEVSGVPSDVALVPAPDLADVAESLGAEGHTVRSLEELDAISDTLERDPDGPVVVDCKVNHEVRHRSKM